MATREPIRLTEEDKRKLLELEDDIVWLREEIEKMKLAGLPGVEKLEKELEDAVRLRENLLKYYG